MALQNLRCGSRCCRLAQAAVTPFQEQPSLAPAQIAPRAGARRAVSCVERCSRQRLPKPAISRSSSVPARAGVDVGERCGETRSLALAQRRPQSAVRRLKSWPPVGPRRSPAARQHGLGQSSHADRQTAGRRAAVTSPSRAEGAPDPRRSLGGAQRRRTRGACSEVRCGWCGRAADKAAPGKPARC